MIGGTISLTVLKIQKIGLRYKEFSSVRGKIMLKGGPLERGSTIKCSDDHILLGKKFASIMTA